MITIEEIEYRWLEHHLMYLYIIGMSIFLILVIVSLIRHIKITKEKRIK